MSNKFTTLQFKCPIILRRQHAHCQLVKLTQDMTQLHYTDTNTTFIIYNPQHYLVKTLHNLPTNMSSEPFLECALRSKVVSACSSPTSNNQRTRVVTGVHSQIILRCSGVKIPHREWAVPPCSIFLWVLLNLASVVMHVTQYPQGLHMSTICTEDIKRHCMPSNTL
jgi:hypothetical protein